MNPKCNNCSKELARKRFGKRLEDEDHEREAADRRAWESLWVFIHNNYGKPAHLTAADVERVLAILRPPACKEGGEHV